MAFHLKSRSLVFHSRAIENGFRRSDRMDWLDDVTVEAAADIGAEAVGVVDSHMDHLRRRSWNCWRWTERRDQIGSIGTNSSTLARVL